MFKLMILIIIWLESNWSPYEKRLHIIYLTFNFVIPRLSLNIYDMLDIRTPVTNKILLKGKLNRKIDFEGVFDFCY